MKKTASAFAAGMARAGSSEEVEKKPPAQGSGNWSKMALASMEESLKETRQHLDVALTTFLEGVKHGQIPIEIPIDQIIDEVGSDRILQAQDDEGEVYSFPALVENIKRRGLKIPIRVRPVDPDWQPNTANPRDVGDQIFALQSGRRRLAACLEIGITPTAFISFHDGDAHLMDLEERFFENAARKDLSLVERLYSIGLIAKGMPGQSQAQIAEIIGVSAPYVSRGLAVIEYFERLKKDLDLKSTTSREIDQTLKLYREEAPYSEDPGATRAREHREVVKSSVKLPFRKQVIGNTHLTLKSNTKGERVLSLRSHDLGDGVIQEILTLIKGEMDRAGATNAPSESD